MAKSCGIHVDQRSVHALVLEGSAKKHKVLACESAALDPGDEPAAALVAFLRAKAKELKAAHENVGLVVDSGAAAFRRLALPFDERSKIEEVLKFEVEGELPQWSIDDVVIDFLVMDSKPGVSSELMVTAVPKARLAPTLAACERAGLEADEAELDASALFNAAIESGVLGEESSQVLVHVGDASTVVVVADGGRLAAMRTIRAGFSPPASPLSQAGEEVDDEDAADDGASVPAAAAESPERLALTTQRIRREIGRTISGARLARPLEAVYVSGHELPGLDDQDAFEVPVRALRVVPGGTDQPLPPTAVIAYGAALRALGGGVLRPHLRREELRFTGAFERLELPLAVASLLTFFLLLVMFVVTDQKLKWRDVGDPAKNTRGDMKLWLQSSNNFMLPNPPKSVGNLENPPEAIENYARRAERGEITDRSTFEQMQVINRMLEAEINKLEVSSGLKSGDGITQPQSALQGSTLVLELLAGLGERAGRYAIRSVQASSIPGRSAQGEYVQVKLDIDFHGASDLAATENYTNFANALQEKPWCIEFERKPTKVFDNGKGIYIEGLTVNVDLSKLPSSEGGKA